MKNIAFYNPTNISFWSWPENWLKSMVFLFVSRWYKVTIFTTKFQKKSNYINEYSYYENLWVKIVEIKSFSLPYSKSPIPIWFLKYINSNFEFFYIFNWYAFQDIFWIIMWKIFKSKVILWVHAPIFTWYYLHDLYQKYLSLPFSRLSAFVHVLNNNDLLIYEKYNKNVFVNWCWINHHYKYDEVMQIKNKHINDNVCKFLFIWRLSSQKNIEIMLEIFSYFNNRENIEFYIAWSWEYTDLAIKYSKKYKNIKYLWFIENELLYEVYKDKHFFINLSHFETFCLCILEAMSFWMNIITTKTYGMATDYGNDFLFKQIDFDSTKEQWINTIESAIKVFFEDKKTYIEISDKAKRLSLDFTWNMVFNEFIKFIN